MTDTPAPASLDQLTEAAVKAKANADAAAIILKETRERLAAAVAADLNKRGRPNYRDELEDGSQVRRNRHGSWHPVIPTEQHQRGELAAWLREHGESHRATGIIEVPADLLEDALEAVRSLYIVDEGKTVDELDAKITGRLDLVDSEVTAYLADTELKVIGADPMAESASAERTHVTRTPVDRTTGEAGEPIRVPLISAARKLGTLNVIPSPAAKAAALEAARAAFTLTD